MGPGRRALAFVLAASTLALAACGGGNPDAAQIEKIVMQIAKDNAAICAHATTQLLGLLGGGRTACVQSARGYQTEPASGIDGDVKVTVTGDTATADYATLTGADRHVTFVKQDGAWMIDAITG